MYLVMLRQAIQRYTRNERGAELVEWAIWVGAVAVAAVAVGSAIQTPLSNAVSNVLNNINTGSS